MQALDKPTRAPRRRFPELIYERWGGRTHYRKGYNEVLKNRKNPPISRDQEAYRPSSSVSSLAICSVESIAGSTVF